MCNSHGNAIKRVTSLLDGPALAEDIKKSAVRLTFVQNPDTIAVT